MIRIRLGIGLVLYLILLPTQGSRNRIVVQPISSPTQYAIRKLTRQAVYKYYCTSYSGYIHRDSSSRRRAQKRQQQQTIHLDKIEPALFR
jgi:hypothetical protein